MLRYFPHGAWIDERIGDVRSGKIKNPESAPISRSKVYSVKQGGALRGSNRERSRRGSYEYRHEIPAASHDYLTSNAQDFELQHMEQ
jgi:hypothetical protein